MNRLKQTKEKVFWPGDPVAPETILNYFKEYCQPEKLNGRILYGTTDPDADRPAETLFIFKICIYHKLSAEAYMKAVYDGVPNSTALRDGDIFLGTYNAVNRIVGKNGADNPAAVVDSFSVIFHLHHVRILYGINRNGVPVNFYYHTPKPAGGTLLLLVRALDSVVREVGCPREERCRPLLQALMRQLYYEVERSGKEAAAIRNPLSVRIKNFMDHNYQANINCSTVCDILKINRSYASTIFREDFGITMIDYLLRLRMDAAKFLLGSEQKLKIDDIANYCGFDDVCYFIRVFRQQTGLTPAKFRAAGKQQEASEKG